MMAKAIKSHNESCGDVSLDKQGFRVLLSIASRLAFGLHNIMNVNGKKVFRLKSFSCLGMFGKRGT